MIGGPQWNWSDLQSGGIVEGTSRVGEREDKYLHLNLASVLWFGRQTTFIFLQHTHIHTHTHDG